VSKYRKHSGPVF